MSDDRVDDGTGRVSIDLDRLGGVRRQVADIDRQIDAASTALLDARAEAARLAATGATDARIGRVVTEATRAGERLAELRRDRERFRDELLERSDEIVAGLDPATFVRSLDGGTPIALLPVRLETRFVDGELRIRVYPDQIHIDAHEPALTDAEIDDGQRYWRTRWEAATEGREEPGRTEAWTALVAVHEPRRARWLVERLRPTNVDREGVSGVAPEFPVPERKSGNWTRPVEATALPDRWVAIGLRGDATVFRVWGRPVPDRLATTPTPDPTVDPDDPVDIDPGVPPGDDPMRWAVDYDAALAVGMAITVRQRDVVRGTRLVDGVDRLVVLGVDWTLTPDEAGARLDELLQAHRFTDGCAFVAHGTPTNNTGSSRSGHSTTTSAAAAEVDPAAAPGAPLTGSAAPDLARALGLSDGALDMLPGASGTEASTAELVQRALWLPTIGHYLADLFDPLVSDADVELTRDHVANWLRPGGPLAALRIGKQPYGILPVAASGGFRPDRPDGIEDKLHRLLTRARPIWRSASRRQPRMGATNDPDEDLLALLQRNPISVTARFRQVLGPGRVNTTGHERLAEAQAMGWAMWRILLGWPRSRMPVVSRHTALEANHHLAVPWVQAGLDAGAAAAPLAPNYLSSIAALTRTRSGRTTLNGQVNGGSLLEVFTAHAALLELDLAAAKVVLNHIGRHDLDMVRMTKTLRTDDLYGVVAGSVDGGVPHRERSTVEVTTPLQQANLVIPATTGALTVAEHVVDLLRRVPERAEVHELVDFVEALEELATRPAGEIERAFRGFLDATSHRLDAWITSLATRRLHTIRERNATGVHLGGYGWVDDLRPSPDPDSLGYIHAPSPQHAATAAILRSGHLSHHGDDHEALDIQLTSDRVERAIPILEGVAAGQQLGALLGYRFERSLRDTDLRLMAHVRALRALAPLRPSSASTGTATDAQETIAAADVVDGVRLLEIWRRDGRAVRAAIDGPFPETLRGLLDDLETTYDAVGDVLMAEAVYQTTLGNYERAGAALAAIDKQERPPEPQVVSTPRSGHAYTQKVLVVLGGSVPGPWRALSRDPRGVAAKAINAWAARLLPRPDDVQFAGRLIGIDASGSEVITELTARLADLSLSPASLVLAGATSGADQPSELETRVAAALVDGVVVGPDDELVVLDEPPGGDPAAVGLGALRALLDWMRALLLEARPAVAEDLALPGGDRTTGVDIDALRTTADAAEAALRDAVDGLAGAVGGTAAQLRRTLLAVSAFGIVSGVPLPGSGNSAELRAALAAQAESVLAEAERRRAALHALAAPSGRDGAPPTEHDVVEHQRTRLQLVFGDGFPVVPTILLAVADPSSSMLAASLADRTSLTAGDPSVVRPWIDRMGLVRPGVERLSRVLTAAELIGAAGTGIDSALVAQLPHTPGQRWLALPNDGPKPADAQLALVAHGSDGFDPAAPTAVLVVDEWNERIPVATEETGVTFHYDAPGARAPQAVLLAVPPELGRAAWDLDTLVDTVLELADLARLRGVAPKDLEGIGPGLPMVYLPDNFTKDRPSVDLFGLVAEWRNDVQHLEVVGKGISL